jgi:hypothetical protein
LDGLIEGYQHWEMIYFFVSAAGGHSEMVELGEIPGIYHLLRRHADPPFRAHFVTDVANQET